ncbi:hypothetical protein Pmani_002588 [Petrolisthes manimaculis]|uniref:Uncharacterized protein n=1 Tax=Petrolisthes manimaculis TaxID=1843537 RepID=A0AAE1QIF8_9EUCA|nr:hypothetical protein Pmani_002588 [Petrolisthes manimaculis]
MRGRRVGGEEWQEQVGEGRQTGRYEWEKRSVRSSEVMGKESRQASMSGSRSGMRGVSCQEWFVISCGERDTSRSWR